MERKFNTIKGCLSIFANETKINIETELGVYGERGIIIMFKEGIYRTRKISA